MNVTPLLKTPNQHSHITLLQLHRFLTGRLSLWRIRLGLLRSRRSRLVRIHASVGNLGMRSLPYRTALGGSNLDGFLLVSLPFKLLAFGDRDDIVPGHIILDVTDRGEGGKETFATERSITDSGDGLMIFGTIENVVQIHLGQFLALLGVVLVEPEEQD